MRKSKNRYFYHILVSPGDAPGAITLNVVWMEREFDAQNCLAVRTHLSSTVFQLFEPQVQKIAVFTYRSPHFCFPWGRSWGNHAKCCMDGKRIRCLYKLSRCMCPYNYNRFWDTARYWSKIVNFFHTPLHSTPPLGGLPSE